MINWNVEFFFFLIVVVVRQKRVLYIAFDGYFFLSHDDHVGLVYWKLVFWYFAKTKRFIFGLDYMAIT